MLYSFFILIYQYAFYILQFFVKKYRKRHLGVLQTTFPIKNNKRIWIHCASAGEYEQSRPLLHYLNQNLNIEICISFFSTSGMEYYESLSDNYYTFYLPFDSKKNAKKLINELKPDYILWVKYEFWQNILSEIFIRKIPCDIIFTDLTHINQKIIIEKNRIFNLLKNFSNIYSITAPESFPFHFQLINDGKWTQAIHNTRTHFKLKELESFSDNKKNILLGSAHLKDIKILSEYLSHHHSHEYRWLIIPHEIDSDTILQIKNILPQATLYNNDISHSDIIIINEIGILKYLYRYAWIAWIGGGFDKSIHNVIEAIAYCIPVISGKNTDGINEAIQLKNEKILRTFSNAQELTKVIDEVENIERQNISSAIQQLFKNNIVDNYSAPILEDIKSHLFI